MPCNGVLVPKFLSDDRRVQENKTCCTTLEYFTHPVKSELENHTGLTSLPVNETYLNSTECLRGYSSKTHSHTDNKLSLVPDKVGFHTKSLDRDGHAGSLASLDDTDVQDEGPCTVDAPMSESFHPLFPDSFRESATPVISSSHSNLYYTSVDDNHEHASDVTQSH